MRNNIRYDNKFGISSWLGYCRDETLPLCGRNAWPVCERRSAHPLVDHDNSIINSQNTVLSSFLFTATRSPTLRTFPSSPLTVNPYRPKMGLYFIPRSTLLSFCNNFST